MSECKLASATHLGTDLFALLARNGQSVEQLLEVIHGTGTCCVDVHVAAQSEKKQRQFSSFAVQGDCFV